MPSFRLYLEILVGGGYLAELEYNNLYLAILAAANRVLVRDSTQIKAELQALGNLTFTDIFATQLLVQVQTLTNNFFSGSEITGFLGSPAAPILIGDAARATDRYWTAVVGPDAKLVLDTAIQLSRTVNTPEGELPLRLPATPRRSFGRNREYH